VRLPAGIEGRPRPGGGGIRGVQHLRNSHDHARNPHNRFIVFAIIVGYSPRLLHNCTGGSLVRRCGECAMPETERNMSSAFCIVSSAGAGSRKSGRAPEAALSGEHAHRALDFDRNAASVIMKPSGPAAQRPSGPAAQRPSGPAAQRPSGPAAQRPSGPAAQRPSGPAAQRPSGLGLPPAFPASFPDQF